MNIPSAKYLKNKARNRLESGKNPKEVILYYAGISTALAFLVTAVQYGLDSQIAQTGGLQNIGTRSILSTVGNVLPILQNVVMMCLGLGYTAAMLRISRRQFASAKTLKAGAERFWPLLSSKLMQGLMYIGILLAASMISLRIFLLTPFSKAFSDAILPLMESGVITPDTMMLDDAVINSLMGTLTPMLIICMVLYFPACLILSYLFRMSDYVIIDNPGISGVAALGKSRQLMRGNMMKLFKVDLSFWWYYLLRMLTTFLLYADIFLNLVGVPLPQSEALRFFGTVLLYLAASFSLDYFLRNKLEVTYALAYTSLVPKEQTNGVVLGNIFDMQ